MLPMIVTPYGHVLYTKMLQMSKELMESLEDVSCCRNCSKERTFVVVETVLRRGRMFQGSDEV